MKTLILTLLLATGLHAAEEPAKKISCRLLNFDRDAKGVHTLQVLDEKGSPTECKLSGDSLSKPVQLPVIDDALDFRKEPDGPVVAKAKVPANIREAMVVFFPSDDPKYAMKPVVLDGSKKAFPDGGCLVLNLYQEDIRFILGEHKIQVPPGKTVYLKRPEQRDNFNMSGVIFQFKTDKGWRPAYETKTRFTEGQRHLYIAYVDGKSKRPRVRKYRD